MFLVSVLNFQRLTLDFQDVQQSNPGKKIWKYFKFKAESVESGKAQKFPHHPILLPAKLPFSTPAP